MWVAVIVGIGCAMCAYAGLYPRFDNGELRLLVAATAGPFGAAVAAFALAAKTWGRAFWRALAMSALLGVACTVLPGVCIAKDDTNALGIVALFGFFFGGPTGAIYGLPIAVLVAMTHKSVVDGSQQSNDRASRLAGVWLALGALFAGFCTWELDVKQGLSGLGPDTLASYVPFMVAGFAFVMGLVVMARATSRIDRRARWIERVRSGGDRAFRVRPISASDDVDALPRLGPDPKLVIEWCGAPDPTTAYRAPAEGTAVALVSESDAARVSAGSARGRSFAAT
jgi:hypothetical protein